MKIVLEAELRTFSDGQWGAIGGFKAVAGPRFYLRKIRVEEGRTGPLAITESGEAEDFK